MTPILQEGCVNNEFSAFPLSRTWRSIRSHVEQWSRAEAVMLQADRYDTFLTFKCDGHEFCVYDDEAMLRLCGDGNCTPALLAEVNEYFAAFLPAQPWGNGAQFGMFAD